MEARVLVVCGNGINADAELAEAFRLSGAKPGRCHVNDLVADPSILDATEILAFPGGFSYGDHLGSGQVLALLCRRSLRRPLEAFVARGGLVIGICNGFQALVKMGMLPNRPGPDGKADWRREVSLIHNASGAFFDGWVPVRFETASRSVWTAGLAPRSLPVRHGEGRFVAKDAATLAALEAEGHVALRYGLPGAAPGEGNPNGSERDIAGICDTTGRVLGLMPHPEAWLVAENGPGRRRGGALPGEGFLGLDLFAKGVAAARAAR
jgi:phosphoribosylformylglycinamidine synthase